jgi:hypothetical protein
MREYTLPVIAIALLIAVATAIVTIKRSMLPGASPNPDVKIGNASYQWHKFVLNNHDYVWISSSLDTQCGVVHDPDCARCKPEAQR